MAFQAKVTLSKNKKGPLTHTGFRGRVVDKGESFRTVNVEEAVYYRAQPGFSVLIEKGKWPTLKSDVIEDEDFDEDTGVDDDDDAVEEDSDDAPARSTDVSGKYERADLKKMSKQDLKALIRSDRDLPLKVKDLPKKASKREIIDLILSSQSPAEEEGDDETVDDDED